jgi:predicted nucleic acid-binding Zn ribbon protein
VKVSGYNRQMERVSHTLQRIVVQALQRLPAEQLPAAAWEFAAGHAVAEKTRVLGCEKQVLSVEVPDANWRAQLYGMAPEFLSGLNKFLRIERIEFKLAGTQNAGAAPKGPATPRRV